MKSAEELERAYQEVKNWMPTAQDRKIFRKHLGKDTDGARMYDVLVLMDALFMCGDPEVVRRAMRVAYHVLSPIQERIQDESTAKYMDEMYK
jgi:hypothetical protein